MWRVAARTHQRSELLTMSLTVGDSKSSPSQDIADDYVDAEQESPASQPPRSVCATHSQNISSRPTTSILGSNKGKVVSAGMEFHSPDCGVGESTPRFDGVSTV